jgi:hypothetical protein
VLSVFDRLFRSRMPLRPHACSLEALPCVEINGIPPGWPLFLPVSTVNSIQH